VGELDDELEGNVKESGGKVTGDKKMEWEGMAQKAKAKVEGAGREITGNEPLANESAEGDKNL
jgi:uncharacterized protein YjbJ (UPF0337 family)